MNLLESHLVQLMEECAEVIQAASKYLRFGKFASDPTRVSDFNYQELRKEILDLYTAIYVLILEEHIDDISNSDILNAFQERKQKIIDTKEVSKILGHISEIKWKSKEFR